MFNLKKKRRFLSGIDVQEISLVNRAATGRRFAIIKDQDELSALLGKLLGGDSPEELMAKAKALTPEAALEIKEALSVLDGYQEIFDDKARAALKTLIAFGLSGRSGDVDVYGQPKKPDAYSAKVDEAKLAELKAKPKSEWTDADKLVYYKAMKKTEGRTDFEKLAGGLLAFGLGIRLKNDRAFASKFFEKTEEGEEGDGADLEDHEERRARSQALRGQEDDETGAGDDNFPSFSLPRPLGR